MNRKKKIGASLLMLAGVAGSILVLTANRSTVVYAAGGNESAGPTCQGDACLHIYNVRRGTRCGTADSIEVDYANDSNALYLRGYVIFNTPQGIIYSPTDILKPGEKKEGVAWVCHGSGEPSGVANTGRDPQSLTYPPKNPPQADYRYH